MLIPSYLTADVVSGLAQSKPITYSLLNVADAPVARILSTQTKFPEVVVGAAVGVQFVAAFDWNIKGTAGVLTTIFTLRILAVEMSHVMSAPNNFEPM